MYHFWFWPLNCKKEVEDKDSGASSSKESESRDILPRKGRAHVALRSLDVERLNFFMVVLEHGIRMDE